MSNALFAEYQSRGLAFHETLADTDDGLRTFELKDHDGYVYVSENHFEWVVDENWRLRYFRTAQIQ